MKKADLEKIKKIFASFKEVKLVYFFGSQARGQAGALSDFDFAVFLEEKDRKKIFQIRTSLMDKIGRLLKTDKVDIVVLNITESPELKYNIITQGKIIFERDLYRVVVEPRILTEYFDFRLMLKKYNFTKD